MRPPGFPFPALVGLDPLKMALQLAAIDHRLSVLIRGDKGAGKSTAARGLVDLLAPGAPFVNLPLGATEDRLLGGLDLEKALKGDAGLEARAAGRGARRRALRRRGQPAARSSGRCAARRGRQRRPHRRARRLQRDAIRRLRDDRLDESRRGRAAPAAAGPVRAGGRRDGAERAGRPPRSDRAPARRTTPMPASFSDRWQDERARMARRPGTGPGAGPRGDAGWRAARPDCRTRRRSPDPIVARRPRGGTRQPCPGGAGGCRRRRAASCRTGAAARAGASGAAAIARAAQRAARRPAATVDSRTTLR